jgi:putative Mg2+ transporter-C (MgtC) family protein
MIKGIDNIFGGVFSHYKRRGLMETVWQAVWHSVQKDFSDLPGVVEVTQLVLRMLLATLLGGLLGYQRERQGKAAGLRTHMLVALGSAFFVLIPLQAGMPLADLSRVLQGLTAGVGFLVAGTILKHRATDQIHGLTTAAGLWLTAAVGVAVGMGREASALLGTVLAFIILALLPQVEPHAKAPETPREDPNARRQDTLQSHDKWC